VGPLIPKVSLTKTISQALYNAVLFLPLESAILPVRRLLTNPPTAQPGNADATELETTAFSHLATQTAIQGQAYTCNWRLLHQTRNLISGGTLAGRSILFQAR
jgi:hypothetical protein